MARTKGLKRYSERELLQELATRHAEREFHDGMSMSDMELAVEKLKGADDAALLAGSREMGEAGIADVESRLLSEQILTFDRPVSGAVRVDVDVERPRTRGIR